MEADSDCYLRFGDTVLLYPFEETKRNKSKAYLCRRRNEKRDVIACRIRPRHFEESCLWEVKSPFKRNRNVVRFSDEVRFYHCQSGKYLVLLGENTSAPAVDGGIVEDDGIGESGSMELGLGNDATDSRFRLMPPGNQFISPGEKVLRDSYMWIQVQGSQNFNYSLEVVTDESSEKAVQSPDSKDGASSAHEGWKSLSRTVRLSHRFDYEETPLKLRILEKGGILSVHKSKKNKRGCVLWKAKVFSRNQISLQEKYLKGGSLVRIWHKGTEEILTLLPEIPLADGNPKREAKELKSIFERGGVIGADLGSDSTTSSPGNLFAKQKKHSSHWKNNSALSNTETPELERKGSSIRTAVSPELKWHRSSQSFEPINPDRAWAIDLKLKTHITDINNAKENPKGIWQMQTLNGWRDGGLFKWNTAESSTIQGRHRCDCILRNKLTGLYLAIAINPAYSQADSKLHMDGSTSTWALTEDPRAAAIFRLRMQGGHSGGNGRGVKSRRNSESDSQNVVHNKSLVYMSVREGDNAARLRDLFFSSSTSNEMHADDMKSPSADGTVRRLYRSVSSKPHRWYWLSHQKRETSSTLSQNSDDTHKDLVVTLLEKSSHENWEDVYEFGLLDAEHTEMFYSAWYRQQKILRLLGTYFRRELWEKNGLWKEVLNGNIQKSVLERYEADVHSGISVLRNLAISTTDEITEDPQNIGKRRGTPNKLVQKQVVSMNIFKISLELLERGRLLREKLALKIMIQAKENYDLSHGRVESDSKSRKTGNSPSKYSDEDREKSTDELITAVDLGTKVGFRIPTNTILTESCNCLLIKANQNPEYKFVREIAILAQRAGPRPKEEKFLMKPKTTDPKFRPKIKLAKPDEKQRLEGNSNKTTQNAYGDASYVQFGKLYEKTVKLYCKMSEDKKGRLSLRTEEDMSFSKKKRRKKTIQKPKWKWGKDGMKTGKKDLKEYQSNKLIAHLRRITRITTELICTILHLFKLMAWMNESMKTYVAKRFCSNRNNNNNAGQRYLTYIWDWLVTEGESKLANILLEQIRYLYKDNRKLLFTRETRSDEESEFKEESTNSETSKKSCIVHGWHNHLVRLMMWNFETVWKKIPDFVTVFCEYGNVHIETNQQEIFKMFFWSESSLLSRGYGRLVPILEKGKIRSSINDDCFDNVVGVKIKVGQPPGATEFAKPEDLMHNHKNVLDKKSQSYSFNHGESFAITLSESHNFWDWVPDFHPRHVEDVQRDQKSSMRHADSKKNVSAEVDKKLAEARRKSGEALEYFRGCLWLVRGIVVGNAITSIHLRKMLRKEEIRSMIQDIDRKLKEVETNDTDATNLLDKRWKLMLIRIKRNLIEVSRVLYVDPVLSKLSRHSYHGVDVVEHFRHISMQMKGLMDHTDESLIYSKMEEMMNEEIRKSELITAKEVDEIVFDFLSGDLKIGERTNLGVWKAITQQHVLKIVLSYVKLILKNWNIQPEEDNKSHLKRFETKRKIKGIRRDMSRSRSIRAEMELKDFAAMPRRSRRSSRVVEKNVGRRICRTLETLDDVYAYLQEQSNTLNEFHTSSSLSRTKWATINLVLQELLQVLKYTSQSEPEQKLPVGQHGVSSPHQLPMGQHGASITPRELKRAKSHKKQRQLPDKGVRERLQVILASLNVHVRIGQIMKMHRTNPLRKKMTTSCGVWEFYSFAKNEQPGEHFEDTMSKEEEALMHKQITMCCLELLQFFGGVDLNSKRAKQRNDGTWEQSIRNSKRLATEKGLITELLEVLKHGNNLAVHLMRKCQNREFELTSNQDADKFAGEEEGKENPQNHDHNTNLAWSFACVNKVATILLSSCISSSDICRTFSRNDIEALFQSFVLFRNYRSDEFSCCDSVLSLLQKIMSPNPGHELPNRVAQMAVVELLDVAEMWGNKLILPFRINDVSKFAVRLTEEDNLLTSENKTGSVINQIEPTISDETVWPDSPLKIIAEDNIYSLEPFKYVKERKTNNRTNEGDEGMRLRTVTNPVEPAQSGPPASPRDSSSTLEGDSRISRSSTFDTISEKVKVILKTHRPNDDTQARKKMVAECVKKIEEAILSQRRTGEFCYPGKEINWWIKCEDNLQKSLEESIVDDEYAHCFKLKCEILQQIRIHIHEKEILKDAKKLKYAYKKWSPSEDFEKVGKAFRLERYSGKIERLFEVKFKVKGSLDDLWKSLINLGVGVYHPGAVIRNILFWQTDAGKCKIKPKPIRQEGAIAVPDGDSVEWMKGFSNKTHVAYSESYQFLKLLTATAQGKHSKAENRMQNLLDAKMLMEKLEDSCKGKYSPKTVIGYATRFSPSKLWYVFDARARECNRVRKATLLFLHEAWIHTAHVNNTALGIFNRIVDHFLAHVKVLRPYLVEIKHSQKFPIPLVGKNRKQIPEGPGKTLFLEVMEYTYGLVGPIVSRLMCMVKQNSKVTDPKVVAKWVEKIRSVKKELQVPEGSIRGFVDNLEKAGLPLYNYLELCEVLNEHESGPWKKMIETLKERLYWRTLDPEYRNFKEENRRHQDADLDLEKYISFEQQVKEEGIKSIASELNRQVKKLMNSTEHFGKEDMKTPNTSCNHKKRQGNKDATKGNLYCPNMDLDREGLFCTKCSLSHISPDLRHFPSHVVEKQDSLSSRLEYIIQRSSKEDMNSKKPSNDSAVDRKEQEFMFNVDNQYMKEEDDSRYTDGASWKSRIFRGLNFLCKILKELVWSGPIILYFICCILILLPTWLILYVFQTLCRESPGIEKEDSQAQTLGLIHNSIANSESDPDITDAKRKETVLGVLDLFSSIRNIIKEDFGRNEKSSLLYRVVIQMLRTWSSKHKRDSKPFNGIGYSYPDDTEDFALRRLLLAKDFRFAELSVDLIIDSYCHLGKGSRTGTATREGLFLANILLNTGDPKIQREYLRIMKNDQENRVLAVVRDILHDFQQRVLMHQQEAKQHYLKHQAEELSLVELSLGFLFRLCMGGVRTGTADYLRDQEGERDQNLVSEAVWFVHALQKDLKEMIDKHQGYAQQRSTMLELVRDALRVLREMCVGPARENQRLIGTMDEIYESCFVLLELCRKLYQYRPGKGKDVAALEEQKEYLRRKLRDIEIHILKLLSAIMEGNNSKTISFQARLLNRDTTIRADGDVSPLKVLKKLLVWHTDLYHEKLQNIKDGFKAHPTDAEDIEIVCLYWGYLTTITDAGKPHEVKRIKEVLEEWRNYVKNRELILKIPCQHRLAESLVQCEVVHANKELDRVFFVKPWQFNIGQSFADLRRTIRDAALEEGDKDKRITVFMEKSTSLWKIAEFHNEKLPRFFKYFLREYGQLFLPAHSSAMKGLINRLRNNFDLIWLVTYFLVVVTNILLITWSRYEGGLLLFRPPNTSCALKYDGHTLTEDSDSNCEALRATFPILGVLHLVATVLMISSWFLGEGLVAFYQAYHESSNISYPTDGENAGLVPKGWVITEKQDQVEQKNKKQSEPERSRDHHNESTGNESIGQTAFCFPIVSLLGIQKLTRHIQIATRIPLLTYYALYLIMAALAVVHSPLWVAFHMVDIVQYVENLRSIVFVIKRHKYRIVATIVLGLIIVYVYAVIIFVFFRNKILFNVDDDTAYTCGNLFDCVQKSIDLGFRNTPTFTHNPEMIFTPLFDLSFFLIVNTILVAIITGIIIDTFAEMRATRDAIHQEASTKCFLCRIDHETFNKCSDHKGYEHHIQVEHNMWSYVYLKYYILERASKHPEKFTGLELLVSKFITDDTKVFRIIPFERTMHLRDSSADETFSDLSDDDDDVFTKAGKHVSFDHKQEG